MNRISIRATGAMAIFQFLLTASAQGFDQKVNRLTQNYCNQQANQDEQNGMVNTKFQEKHLRKMVIVIIIAQPT